MSIKDRVRRYLARRLRLPEIPVALERLARLGFTPGVVFDVGAYRGDFARLCRTLWPAARIAAFEPLPEKAAQLRSLAGALSPLDVFECALGASCAANVVLHMRETASSILEEHVAKSSASCRCRMRTVDEVVQTMDYPTPDLLKIDVQGYELEVLKGAECSLSRAQVILAEVNLIDIHEGVPLLAQTTQWLDARGWVAYDVCGLTRRPLDGALWQADLLFVPKDSRLRSDKRWAS